MNENGDVGVYSDPQSVITDEARMSIILLSLSVSLSLSHSLSLTHTHTHTHTSAAGPVRGITVFPPFFTITITWEQPATPNGVLRDNRVEYGLRDSTQITEIVPDTTFTTPNTLERGTEYTFTVTASTGAGLGIYTYHC